MRHLGGRRAVGQEEEEEEDIGGGGDHHRSEGRGRGQALPPPPSRAPPPPQAQARRRIQAGKQDPTGSRARISTANRLHDFPLPSPASRFWAVVVSASDELVLGFGAGVGVEGKQRLEGGRRRERGREGKGRDGWAASPACVAAPALHGRSSRLPTQSGCFLASVLTHPPVHFSRRPRPPVRLPASSSKC